MLQASIRDALPVLLKLLPAGDKLPSFRRCFCDAQHRRWIGGAREI